MKTLEEYVELGCIGVYGKTWNGPKEKQPGEEMKKVWRDLVRKAVAPVYNGVIEEVIKEIEK